MSVIDLVQQSDREMRMYEHQLESAQLTESRIKEENKEEKIHFNKQKLKNGSSLG